MEISEALLHGVERQSDHRCERERAAKLQNFGRKDITNVVRARVVLCLVFHLVLKLRVSWCEVKQIPLPNLEEVLSGGRRRMSACQFARCDESPTTHP